jgi:hypothetical protein
MTTKLVIPHIGFSITWRPSKAFTFKSSPLKPLNQIKPNLAGMVFGWSLFKIVSDGPTLHSRWLLDGCQVMAKAHMTFGKVS